MCRQDGHDALDKSRMEVIGQFRKLDRQISVDVLNRHDR